MKHDILAKWLKVVIAGATLIGLGCCIFVIPMAAGIMRERYPEFGYCILPWEILIYTCVIPCFAAMVISWKIAGNIQRDKSFCMENARLFKLFSILSLVDSLFFLLANVVFFFLGINHPGFMIINLFIVFVGMAGYVCTAALSYLVSKAASLQEDNDLTI